MGDISDLSRRIANMVAHAVVQLVDDTKKLLHMQLGGLVDSPIDGAEYHQPYGFSSVPLAGAEAITLFENGDRARPIVITASDRRYRPTGGAPGQVTMHHYNGAKITMLENGNIVLQAKSGAQVLVDDGTGASAIPTMADFNGIISIMSSAGVGAATALPAAVTSYQSSHPTWPAGTAVLKAK